MKMIRIFCLRRNLKCNIGTICHCTEGILHESPSSAWIGQINTPIRITFFVHITTAQIKESCLNTSTVSSSRQLAQYSVISPLLTHTVGIKISIVQNTLVRKNEKKGPIWKTKHNSRLVITYGHSGIAYYVHLEGCPNKTWSLEDGDSKLLQNFGNSLQINTASYSSTL